MSPSGEAREAAESDHHLATRLYRRGRIVDAQRYNHKSVTSEQRRGTYQSECAQATCVLQCPKVEEMVV